MDENKIRHYLPPCMIPDGGEGACEGFLWMKETIDQLHAEVERLVSQALMDTEFIERIRNKAYELEAHKNALRNVLDIVVESDHGNTYNEIIGKTLKDTE